MDQSDDQVDLAGAQGKLAMFIASLLERAGVATTAEFAELLGAYASVVSETQPGEGALLASWAATVGARQTH